MSAFKIEYKILLMNFIVYYLYIITCMHSNSRGFVISIHILNIMNARNTRPDN